MDETRNQARRTNSTLASELDAKSERVLPARGFVILTCMDARIDPTKLAALREGDAHIIRNAGGRATDDAIRSLVMSYKVLGTREWFVVQHSQCGMALFSDEISRDLLVASQNIARHNRGAANDSVEGPDAQAGAVINGLAIQNQQLSLVTDIERIRSHPLVSADVAIYGYIYQVETGRLVEVDETTQIGHT
jgi:carbonic anhydrase